MDAGKLEPERQTEICDSFFQGAIEAPTQRTLQEENLSEK